MKNKNLGKNGFSLIQMMVALGLLSVVALGLIQITTNANRESRFLVSRMGSAGVVQELRSAMSNSNLCRQVFGGKTLSLGGETDLTLRLPGSGITVAGGQDIRAQNIHVKRIYATRPVTAGNAVNGNRLFQLNVIIESGTFVAPGSGEKSREFKAQQVGTMIAELSAANGILSCYTLESAEDLLRIACEKFGGIFNPATKECDLSAGLCAKMGGTWSGTPPSCQMEGKGCSPCSGSFPGLPSPKAFYAEGETCHHGGGSHNPSCTSVCINSRWINISCSPPPDTSCFTMGTLVTMADGTLKPIEEIRQGDRVLGRNGINSVLGVEKPALGARKLFRLNGGRAFVTAEHPFWTPGGWKSLNPAATFAENPDLGRIGRLSAGDQVWKFGSWRLIRSVESATESPDTILYNLLLDGDHTYFADGYLVHNKI